MPSVSALLSGSERLRNLVSRFQTPQMQTLPRSLSPASVDDFNAPKACDEFSWEIFVYLCSRWCILYCPSLGHSQSLAARQTEPSFLLLPAQQGAQIRANQKEKVRFSLVISMQIGKGKLLSSFWELKSSSSVCTCTKCTKDRVFPAEMDRMTSLSLDLWGNNYCQLSRFKLSNFLHSPSLRLTKGYSAIFALSSWPGLGRRAGIDTR